MILTDGIMKKFFFEKAYLSEGHNIGWQNNVLVTVDDRGFISAVAPNAHDDAVEKIIGLALPGIPNSHSHAFQKILAGRTEYKANHKDNFWGWRNLMYQFAGAIDPQDLTNIASYLYLEMVKAGYSAVAEFHYLHHQPGGMAYDDPAEMSMAIIHAAQTVGIGLTQLPVLYMKGGFGNIPLEKNQRRFGHDVNAYLRLLERLQDHHHGVAFHSLRAVPKAALVEVLDVIDRDMPVHIHIAEQEKEVEGCLKHMGQRPVEWLLSQHNLDHRWCLVHATHMTEDETAALAKSGAVVSICPTTEANLGDGFFPLARFLGAGGRISVGSDGNSLIDPIEEIRWLEYGARLCGQQRNIAATEADPHTGSVLYNAIQKGGAQALGQKTGAIAVGYRADIIVLDNALFHQVPEKNILDALIFSGGGTDIKHVMVAGKWSIKDRYHAREEAIIANYQKTITKLT